MSPYSDFFNLHYENIYTALAAEADKLEDDNDNPSTHWLYDTIRYLATILIYRPEWRWIRWDNGLNETTLHYLQMQPCTF